MILNSCRSRAKKKTHLEINSEQIILKDSVVAESKIKEQQNIVKQEIKKQEKEKVNEGDIFIKGKTDSLNDFIFHNVIEGDTLADFYIKGNAEFVIKNRYKNNNKTELVEEKKEELNLVAQIARKSVAQSTINKVVKEINSTETEVKNKGFSLPIYLILGLGSLLAVFLFFLSKKIPSIKFWNKKDTKD